MESSLLPLKIKKDIWYREPWLLLVVGGPLIVVCASLITGFIAFRGADQVVAKDYYRQGLMINTNLQRDAKARELTLSANMSLNLATGRLNMTLTSLGELPDTIQISLASSGRQSGSVEEVVRRLPMKQIKPGVYEGDLSTSVKLTDDALRLLHVKVETNAWRLTGDWNDPLQRNLVLTPVH
jgi:uncharacterized protein